MQAFENVSRGGRILAKNTPPIGLCVSLVDKATSLRIARKINACTVWIKRLGGR